MSRLNESQKEKGDVARNTEERIYIFHHDTESTDTTSYVYQWWCSSDLMFFYGDVSKLLNSDKNKSEKWVLQAPY